ncbi:MAG: FtsH-binding integral membrane protein [Cellvibrionaceae bacterium]|jgi:FtsH-binding integral membrane protein
MGFNLKNDSQDQYGYYDEGKLSQALAEAMLNVYTWMGFGLLITAAVAWFSQDLLLSVLQAFPYAMLLAFAIEIGIVWWLSRRIMTLDPDIATAGFLAYAAVNGFTMAFVFIVYDLGSVALVFGITTSMFLAMSVIGYTTKMDLSKFGSYLMMGVIGLIVASIGNIWLQSSPLQWIISYAGVAIFLGLTVYDTQKIKNMTIQALASGDEATLKRVGIRGALSLYLDFINLFLFLLRILGRRK